MIKELVHIFFLLVVIALVALRSAGGEDIANRADLWIFVICITVTLVDAALAIAASFTRRPVLGKVVWGGAFFVLGCALWAVRALPSGGEEDVYNRMKQQWAENPYAQDDEGETLFTRAAALGKVAELQRMIQRQTPPADQLIAAGCRAVEGNHVAALEELARLGLSASSARDGVPLLHACRGAVREVRCHTVARHAWGGGERTRCRGQHGAYPGGAERKRRCRASAPGTRGGCQTA